MARLSADKDDNGAGIISAVALTEQGLVVAHAAVIFDSKRPKNAGLFGHVFTEVDHRQKGLSSVVVSEVLAQYDIICSGILTLGTGSPHAVRTYTKQGFVQLAGGLDGS